MAEAPQREPGAIYIAAKNLRGASAPVPPGMYRVDVTSAQPKWSRYRTQLSPMHPAKGGYKGFWCFEHYWQSGKVYEGISHAKTVAWWKGRKKATRRYPTKARVLYAKWNHTVALGCVDSRKQVYVPEYMAYVKEAPVIKELRESVLKGQRMVVVDFDGPRDASGAPTCLRVTREMLLEKIEDPKHPFGHGYVVAALLAGIDDYF